MKSTSTSLRSRDIPYRRNTLFLRSLPSTFMTSSAEQGSKSLGVTIVHLFPRQAATGIRSPFSSRYMSTSAEYCTLSDMFYSPELLTAYAEAYCKRLNFKIEERLGRGLQGMVFLSSNQSAIKVHAERAAFTRELQVYSRLAQYGVQDVRGLIVPTLRAFDDNYLIIEMSLVRPPFIVDFGGAYLDKPAPHADEPEVKARWYTERKEKFGDDLMTINAVLADFERLYGIFLADVHPGNIRLRTGDSDTNRS